MKSILFDSYAILAYAQDEAGADQVEHLLKSVSEAGTNAYMSEINLDINQLYLQR